MAATQQPDRFEYEIAFNKLKPKGKTLDQALKSRKWKAVLKRLVEKHRADLTKHDPKKLAANDHDD